MPEIILTPGGRLDSTTAPAFEREMIAAMQAEARRLLIDLANLAYVSSAGLRVLLLAAARCTARPLRMARFGLGHLRLCRLEPVGWTASPPSNKSCLIGNPQKTSTVSTNISD